MPPQFGFVRYFFVVIFRCYTFGWMIIDMSCILPNASLSICPILVMLTVITGLRDPSIF